MSNTLDAAVHRCRQCIGAGSVHREAIGIVRECPAARRGRRIARVGRIEGRIGAAQATVMTTVAAFAGTAAAAAANGTVLIASVLMTFIVRPFCYPTEWASGRNQ